VNGTELQAFLYQEIKKNDMEFPLKVLEKPRLNNKRKDHDSSAEDALRINKVNSYESRARLAD